MEKLLSIRKLWVPIFTVISVLVMFILTFVPLSSYCSYSDFLNELPPPYVTISGGKYAYIDLNLLSAYMLKGLPYIGMFADDIVSLRSELGGFTSLEEIMLVDGIGITSYQNVRVMLLIKDLK